MENKDFEKTVNTRRATTNEVAYRDGYMSGRDVAEQQRYADQLHADHQRARENESAASGLLTGLVLAILLGAGIFAVFWFTQDRNNPVNSVAPKQEKETRIIEKTTDRVHEVPSPALPKVEVNIPNPLPDNSQPRATASPAPAQPQPSPSPTNQPAPSNSNQ